MRTMFQSATDVRANFSQVVDQAIHDRPQFFQRTRDKALLVGVNTLDDILQDHVVPVCIAPDDAGGFMATSDVLEDIIATGDSEDAAEEAFAEELLEYAQEFYDEYGLYSRAPNRKGHLPYVVRALSLATPDAVRRMLKCQAGKN